VEEPQAVWAVVIGISKYNEVRQLEYARADAEAFSAWLSQMGAPPDHVLELFDGDATLTRVRASLGWLKRMAELGDLVFFYFAGHGYQGPDDNGDELDGYDEFLVLADTMKSALEDTALRDDEFGQFLDQVRSDHVTVIFDSCFSGGQGRSLTGGSRPLPGTVDLFEDFELDGKLIFAAASESQEAQEDGSLGHGIFTYFLLQGLRGAADGNADFRITADELSTYVTEQVQTYVRQQLGRTQDPQLRGRGSVGIVLSHVNEPPTARFSVVPEMPTRWMPAVFVDASADDRGILSREWDFGDGETSTEQAPTHSYARAGIHIATLTVVDSDGATAVAEERIEVAPPGEVKLVGDGQVVVSLGSYDAVRVGDRFEVVRVLDSSTGEQFVEWKGVIEIVEILAADRSKASIVQQGDDVIEVRDQLRPVAEP
jgi:hypothetical protein